MRLYGHDLTPEQMRDRLGRMEQVASTALLVDDEGPARGMRRLVVRCGELAFDLHPDRALDIGAATFRGIPLAWASPSGLRSPVHRGDSPMGWLDTFSGGLVATCGLDAFGSPSQVDGEVFPLHGRIGTEQADHVACDAAWMDDGDYEIRVSGRVEQARLFGESLELRRTVRCRLGRSAIELHDIVTNTGTAGQPHMLLYHLNIGWPLLDEGAELHLPSREVQPRDDDARAGLAEWNRFAPPVPAFPEQVFRHVLPQRTEVTAALRNPRLGLELSVAFSSAELPHLFQWKLLASRGYVLGLEPANCPVIEGRATAVERGVLPLLAPGESRQYRLTFAVRGL